MNQGRTKGTIGALVGLEDLASVLEVEDFPTGIILKGLQEDGRGFGEENTFAPAGGHSWKQGQRGRRGRTESVTRKEVEEEMCGETRDGCGQGVPLIPEIAIIILVRGGHELRKHLMIT